MHFLGNLADTNNNFVLEPCVLGGPCDGRTPRTEPAVVEGAPPVPMIVRNWVISIDRASARATPLRVATYPSPGATDVYQGAVVKVFFSEPVSGVDARRFRVTDSRGVPLPGRVDQIGEGAWGFFPNQVLLGSGKGYTARLKAGICDVYNHCIQDDVVWRFTVSRDPVGGTGDTSIPAGFRVPTQLSRAPLPSSKQAAALHTLPHAARDVIGRVRPADKEAFSSKMTAHR